MQKWIISGFSVLALIAGMLVYQSQQFDFETLSGERYEWQDMHEQWIVVNYFAEWCAPCLKEVPELNAFDEWTKTQPDVQLFAISYDPLSQDALAGIRDKYEMDFALLVPAKTHFVPIKKPQYLPATYVIKPDGSITPPLLGDQTNETLQQAIAQLKQSF